jgi:hypothetical protein
MRRYAIGKLEPKERVVVGVIIMIICFDERRGERCDEDP